MWQGSSEGGFMGRTNKLVDGCYSFWQGAVFPILQTHAPSERGPPTACVAVPRGEELLDSARNAHQQALVNPAVATPPPASVY